MTRTVSVVVDVQVNRSAPLCGDELLTLAANVHDCLLEHLQPEAGEVAGVQADAVSQWGEQ